MQKIFKKERKNPIAGRNNSEKRIYKILKYVVFFTIN